MRSCKRPIRKLEDANRAQKEAMEQRLLQQARDYAIAQAVREYDPKNQKAVLAILDHEKIQVQGDAVHGLAEQMEALKQSDGYLFNLPQKASFTGVRACGIRGTACRVRLCPTRTTTAVNSNNKE